MSHTGILQYSASSTKLFFLICNVILCVISRFNGINELNERRLTFKRGFVKRWPGAYNFTWVTPPPFAVNPWPRAWCMSGRQQLAGWLLCCCAYSTNWPLRAWFAYLLNEHVRTQLAQCRMATWRYRYNTHINVDNEWSALLMAWN